MITVVNFADDKYESFRKLNTLSAYNRGKADRVIEYSLKDIDEIFRSDNAKILSYARGAGLWLWKPYFILKALELVDEGEYLFYADSGSFFVNDLSILCSVMNDYNQDLMGFELPLLERQFTKNETFHLMDYQDTGLNQILGSYILVKKTVFSVAFIQQWLHYMCDERVVSPQRFCFSIKENEDYIAHREDQSVFSILYHKCELISFRDPSQYGLWPWEYMWTPKSTLPTWKYRPNEITYSRCKYPSILMLTRSMPYWKFNKTYFIKLFLYKLGIYSERTYVFKYKGRYS